MYEGSKVEDRGVAANGTTPARIAAADGAPRRGLEAALQRAGECGGVQQGYRRRQSTHTYTPGSHPSLRASRVSPPESSGLVVTREIDRNRRREADLHHFLPSPPPVPRPPAPRSQLQSTRDSAGGDRCAAPRGASCWPIRVEIARRRNGGGWEVEHTVRALTRKRPEASGESKSESGVSSVIVVEDRSSGSNTLDTAGNKLRDSAGPTRGSSRAGESGGAREVTCDGRWCRSRDPRGSTAHQIRSSPPCVAVLRGATRGTCCCHSRERDTARTRTHTRPPWLTRRRRRRRRSRQSGVIESREREIYPRASVRRGARSCSSERARDTRESARTSRSAARTGGKREEERPPQLRKRARNCCARWSRSSSPRDPAEDRPGRRARSSRCWSDAR